MKNLTVYPGDSFAIFEAALGRKEDSDNKTLLTNSLETIRARYDVYNQHYDNNTLERIIEDPNITVFSQYLETFYGYDNAAGKIIRNAIENNQHRQIRYRCPYCTFNLHDSLDHIIPQTEFPEFAIHSRNLIPCCTDCNRRKQADWRQGIGGKLLLNLYRDTVADVQYLFVDIFLDADGEIDFQFLIRKPVDIDPDLWVLIERHYTRLDLRRRMHNVSITALTELLNTAKNFLGNGLTRAQFEEQTINTEQDNRRYFGVNHWKSVLHQALVLNQDFWDCVAALE
jgi:5-methylcytosine-specific restriction endonuclease McrA